MSPEATPAPNPDATPIPSGENTSYTPRGNTGFMRTVDRTRHGWENIQQKTNSAASRIMAGTDSFDRWMRSKLRFERPEAPEQVPYLLPPKGLLYDWGDRLDATAGNVTRRGWEIGYSAGATGAATIRTLIPPASFAISTILSPIQSIKSPIKTITNATKALIRSATSATRVFTAGTKTLSNIFINGPTRLVDELVHRGIERPTQRKKDWLIFKPFKIIGGAAGWLAEKPRKLTEFLTRPLYKADKWLAERQ